MKVLFIGGYLDGERREFSEISPTYQCPIPVQNVLAEIAASVVPDRAPYNVEHYRLEAAHAKGSVFHFYVQNEMSLADAFERLLNGYTPSLMIG